MKKTTLYIAFLFILLLSMNTIFADFVVNNQDQQPILNDENNIQVIYLVSNNDFAATISNQKLTICQCDSATAFLTITNTGSLASKYYIDINKDLVSISENAVVLQPGETKQIKLFYQASCSSLFSKYVTIKITSINGITETIKQKISFKNCQNLAASFEKQDDLNINPCESKVLKLRVLNTGNFNELYTIQPNKNINSYITLNYNQLSIQPNSYADVDVLFTPTCDMYGKQNIELKIKTDKSNRVSTINQTIIIDRNYIFNTSLQEEELFVCEGETYNTNLILENFNSFENEFIFDIDAPSFVEFNFPQVEGKGEAKSLILQGESQTNIPVVLSPSKNKEGDYEIKIKTTSIKGDLTQTKIIPVHIQNCYDLSINFAAEKLNVCGKDTLNQQVIIENKGIKETPVSLHYIGPNFAELNTTLTNVNSKSKTNVSLFSNNVRDINEKYPLTVELYHKGELIDKDKLMIKITTAEDCYNIKVQEDHIGIYENQDSFKVNVQNKGLRYGTYLVELTTSPDYLSIKEKTITLGSTQKGNLTFLIDNESIQENALIYHNNSIIGLTAKPTIILTHIESNTRYYHTFMFEVKDYPWYQKAWTYIYSLPNCLLVFLSLSLGFLICLIILIVKILRRFATRMKFKFTKLFAILALILIIIAGMYLFSNNEIPFNLPLKSDSNLNLNMYENTQKTINLTPYFQDEDEDIILYSAFSTEQESNLLYSINQSNLLIIPNENWFGNETFLISATDSYLETAMSEPILINVIHVKKYNNLNDMFSAYCPFLCWIMLILFLLFLILCFSYRKMSKEEIKKEQRELMLEQKRIEREKLKQQKIKEANKKSKSKKRK